MEILLSALVLGLMGSFHCVGMCGPIALSLPLQQYSIANKVAGSLLYNLGRTITYGLMGALFGLIGQGFQMAGLQRWVSVVMGSVMILAVMLPSLFNYFRGGKELPFAGSVRKGLQKLFRKKSLGHLLLIGMLNGLLPCGLVYMAIAGAIGTADLFQSIIYMLLFGLGTIPMLMGVTLLGNLASLSMRKLINRATPFVVVLIGVLFILRGLSLGIPYVSPPQTKLVPAAHTHTMHSVDSIPEQHRSCCGSD